MGDAVDKRPGFTRARTGDNQKRSFQGGGRLELRLVQFLAVIEFGRSGNGRVSVFEQILFRQGITGSR